MVVYLKRNILAYVIINLIFFIIFSFLYMENIIVTKYKNEGTHIINNEVNINIEEDKELLDIISRSTNNLLIKNNINFDKNINVKLVVSDVLQNNAIGIINVNIDKKYKERLNKILKEYEKYFENYPDIYIKDNQNDSSKVYLTLGFSISYRYDNKEIKNASEDLKYFYNLNNKLSKQPTIIPYQEEVYRVNNRKMFISIIISNLLLAFILYLKRFKTNKEA